MDLRIAVGSFFPSTHCQRIGEGVLGEADRLRAEFPAARIEVWSFSSYSRLLRDAGGVRFDGAVIYGNYFEVVHGSAKDGWPPMDSLGIPWINTSNRFAFPGAPKVTQDDAAIGREAGRFLREKAPSCFGFVGFPEDFVYSRERRDGFLEGAGIAAGDLLEEPGFYLYGAREYPGETMERLERWLASLPDRSAVFCANDEKAAGSLALLESAGRRVPQDIVLLGVDDDPLFTRRHGVSLSSIDPGAAVLGARAARLLFRWLRERVRPPDVTRLRAHRIVERLSTDQTAVDDTRILRLLRHMRSYPERNLSLEEMARTAGLHPRTLARRFRRATGTSPTQYLLTLRVDRARRLLVESDLPVAGIAELCGFNDLKWFYRAFARQTGSSPSRYRAGSSGEVSG